MDIELAENVGEVAEHGVTRRKFIKRPSIKIVLVVIAVTVRQIHYGRKNHDLGRIVLVAIEVEPSDDSEAVRLGFDSDVAVRDIEGRRFESNTELIGRRPRFIGVAVRRAAEECGSLDDVDTPIRIDVPVYPGFTAVPIVLVSGGAAPQRKIMPRPLRLQCQTGGNFEERIGLRSKIETENIVIHIEGKLERREQPERSERQSFGSIFWNCRRCWSLT